MEEATIKFDPLVFYFIACVVLTIFLLLGMYIGYLLGYQVYIEDSKKQENIIDEMGEQKQ